MKKAIARSQAGDHSAAIEIYLQAYTIVPNSLLLSNIGAEFQQSGRPQEALRYFCMYLDKDPSGTNAPYATAQARTLQIQLGNKNVDDRNVCAPPKPESKEPREPRNPTKEPRNPIKEPPSEESPSEEPPEPRISTKRRPEADDPDDTRPQSGGGTLKYVGLAVGVAGLAAVGIGTYDGLQAKRISDELTNHPAGMPWPDNIRDLQNRGQAYENLQIGFFIAGGVLVATGAIVFAVSRSDESPKRSSDKTTVSVTPTTNGFAVFGKF